VIDKSFGLEKRFFKLRQLRAISSITFFQYQFTVRSVSDLNFLSEFGDWISFCCLNHLLHMLELGIISAPFSELLL
jgi:hypothetical protein